MGWFIDKEGCEGHEGYLVAVVERSAPHAWMWRELGSGTTDERAADKLLASGKKNGIQVRTVQVACDCGWRSPRFVAPFGTWWAPFSLELPAHETEGDPDRKSLGRADCFEARCRARWVAHVYLERSYELSPKEVIRRR